ncbi:MULTISPECIES: glycosyl hydrolase family 18 protein [unclassified Pseudomonas]|uniref:carbohydrate-binding protein n=1 Tax=unclassified Pseudomonas TaxID=196821 RepID=UPI0008380D8C|nr:MULTISPECIES: glycosyl hydrolase family 18 protein [unclassified Pseudomonas]QIH09206.1 chitinase [Pseudomonas sp. BIOMIG1BAC]
MDTIDFSLIKSQAADAASLMPSLAGKKILMGFWHNWAAGAADGYQRGQFANLSLLDVPKEYNVVAVAFMKGNGIPTFKPYNLSDAEFRRQVGVLNSQGRAVLISLGGADAHIELHKGNEQPLANEIIRLVETYGFDGLDIDLEQSAIDFADNKSVLPAALKLVKDHYAGQGKHFIISMAPEFPYLTSNGKYVAYLQALEGYYDFVAPQYYNQGGDGLWVSEANGGQGAWIAQNNDAMKEDFLFYLSDSLASGTRGFTRIAADKLVIGLPSNVDAAATGYVIDPAALGNAFKRLQKAGHGIKGLMTWSVNWDDGINRQGTPYSWEFCKRYAPLIHGDGGEPERPGAPGSLAVVESGRNNVRLSWSLSGSVRPVEFYTLYRDGKAVGNTASLGLDDQGLNPDTQYNYFVTATDTQGRESLPSRSVTARTAGGAVDPKFPEWRVGQHYRKGDGVSYEGNRYLCLQEHTSNPAWTPLAAFTLWSKVLLERHA